MLGAAESTIGPYSTWPEPLVPVKLNAVGVTSRAATDAGCELGKSTTMVPVAGTLAVLVVPLPVPMSLFVPPLPQPTSQERNTHATSEQSRNFKFHKTD